MSVVGHVEREMACLFYNQTPPLERARAVSGVRLQIRHDSSKYKLGLTKSLLTYCELPNISRVAHRCLVYLRVEPEK